MYGDDAPAAGLVAGIGRIHGNELLVVANDATVKGGTYYPITVKKHLRAQEIALENRLPCVYLVDSGGAFLPLQDEVFPDREHFGRIFYNQARLSAAGIPQVAVVMGSCTAGGAYVPAMCDESIIVRNQGTIFLGGPPLVKAATGEVVDAETLGGGDVHARTSGVVDHLADNDAHALAMAREIVGSLNHRPAAWLGRREAGRCPPTTASDLYGIVPRDLRQPYDVREVIARLVDGSEFHEFKALYGKTLVCGFAHLWGYPVAILANNGILFSESALKGAHFVQLANRAQGAAPLPAEHHGLHGRQALRDRRHRARRREDGHGRRLLDRAEAHGRDRRLLRRRQLRDVRARLRRRASCGPGRMRASRSWAANRPRACSRPCAATASRRRAAPGREAEQNEFMAGIRDQYERQGNPYYATARLWDDGVIDPLDTRRVLGLALEVVARGPAPLPESYGVFRM